MVNKKILIKNGLKRVLQTKCGLSLLLAAFIFNGCASWPTEGPSGTFTITGIPSEYEGKFVKLSLYLPLQIDKSKLISSAAPKEVARGPVTAVTNGELALPLYGKEAGYFGSDTVNVCLRIGDTAKEVGGRYGNAGFDFIFADVPFEDGVKEVKWNDQVTPGFITITNIPAEFKGSTATVHIGHPDYELKATSILGAPIVTGTEATCTAILTSTENSTWQGILTEKFIASVDGKYLSFPQSGTRDVIVQLAKFADPNKPSTLSYTLFRFKTAPIQDGKIILDLSQGVRQ
jgi:hypothetical protein